MTLVLPVLPFTLIGLVVAVALGRLRPLVAIGVFTLLFALSVGITTPEGSLGSMMALLLCALLAFTLNAWIHRKRPQSP